MGLSRTRWESVWLLRRGEYGYVGHELAKLVEYLPADFALLVMHLFRECDYTRVADLIEYRWPEEK